MAFFQWDRCSQYCRLVSAPLRGGWGWVWTAGGFVWGMLGALLGPEGPAWKGWLLWSGFRPVHHIGSPPLGGGCLVVAVWVGCPVVG